MAGYADGENNFSDDEFDDLPANTLAELEKNAIQLTQAVPQRGLKAPPSSDYGDGFDDEDLDDAVVIDEARSAPAVVPVFNRHVPGQATQRDQFRQQRYGAISNPSLPSRQRPYASEVLNQPKGSPLRPQGAVPIPQNESMLVEQGSQPETGYEVEALQKQIEELVKERNALRENLSAKAGEISIVRSKQEKAAKEHEREMAAIRKLNDEKQEKQKRALEAARIAQQQAVTEREFLKRDLSEEAGRVRMLNKNKAREAEKTDPAGLSTPKKKKALPHRDGFDDDEIEMISPSKISPSKFQKQRPGTPSKAGKRKRKTVESPIAPLEVIQFNEPSVEEPKPKASFLDEALLSRLGIQDDRFDFLGTMLDHRPKRDHLRTIEALGQHALPSKPKESFESIILGKIPTLGLNKPISNHPIEFCELLISMWSQCMEEKYYTPVYLFVDILTLALELKTGLVAPHIIDSLVPLAQLTIDLVAIPRFNKANPDPYDRDISVPACLALLHLEALGCMSDEEHITRFWKLIRWDFILMMLSTNHPIPDFQMMLQIMSTGVLRDSFGSVSTDLQDPYVGYIIDRLTYPLYEVPCLPMVTEKVERGVLLNLRLNILQLLTDMTRSPYSSMALAVHQYFISRVVILMSDEFDTLYDYQSGHEKSTQIITMCLRILYHLIMAHEKTVKIQEKLSVIPGGWQKYEICLARLNFSEDGGVLEAGIGSDVPGLALQLLESAVTMEEGDAIQEAFGGS